MIVLLDHCVPRKFGRLLPGHEVRTTAFMKWNELTNGELLAAAAPLFGAFVTVDSKLRFQQHTGELPLPVLALEVVSNRIEDLIPLAPLVLTALASGLQRRVYVVRLNPSAG